MKLRTTKIAYRSQRGVALLIAIFVLMMISIIATALILTADMETAFKGNYKTSMQAFYSARAGLEEGRARLWSGHPNKIGSLAFPASGDPMPLTDVIYITNPAAGEIVNPIDLSAGNPYADTEYLQEWGNLVNPAKVSTIPSAPNGGGISGPLYKWVRITARSEKSANLAVNGGGFRDFSNPLFFDGTRQVLSTGGGAAVPGASQAWQVFTVTALAVTNGTFGSRRLVQYVVAPSNFGLSFPSALTLAGPNPTFAPPNSVGFTVVGGDRTNNSPTLCPFPAQNTKSAIGVLGIGNVNPAKANIPAILRDNYTDLNSITRPSVFDVTGTLPPNMQTVVGLEAIVGKIESAATEVVTGPATSLPKIGTPSEPVIAVVHGDLTLSGTYTGTGILVVTGNLNLVNGFDWQGVILVIGQGNMTVSGLADTRIIGAALVAKTRDPANNPLALLGSPSVTWSSSGAGVFYDSCWINRASSGSLYQVLSFREIQQ